MSRSPSFRPFVPFLALHAVLLLLLAAACGTADQRPVEQRHTLVFLKTGPETPPAEEQQKAFAGHFANMTRLANEGHLLLAGPFGTEKHDASLRGIFVLATGDRAEAERLAKSDPALIAGIMVPECHDFATAAPMQEMLRRELARTEAAKQAGRTPKPGDDCRTYALLIADDGERALAALHGNPSALLVGRLDGTRAFAILDAADAAAAKANLVPLLQAVGPHTVDDWFGTDLVAELPRMARG